MADIIWTNEIRELGSLVPWEDNPRFIEEEERERLAESLDKFGQIQTIAIGPDDEIYDGHQRQMVWGALDRYGPNYLVDVRVASRPLTEEERQQLVIFLHRGTVGKWNWDMLSSKFDSASLLSWGFEKFELNEIPQAPTLRDLAEKYGDEPGERDFWPVIKIQVSPETNELYNSLMEAIPLDDDAECFEHLISCVDTLGLEDVRHIEKRKLEAAAAASAGADRSPASD